MIIIQQIPNCLITLQPSVTPYSKAGKRKLFGNKDCAHTIPYTINEMAVNAKEKLMANQTRISISGVRDKFSMKLHKKQLHLTDTGGTYILKPKTSNLLHNEYVPINEQLTMLIAANVFNIETAVCGLVLFTNEVPAYITKRFDVAKDGTRYLKEDFASVLQRTEPTHGKNYKYNSSYEEMALAINKFLPAATIQKEKLFALAIFNYLMSNGDAHLKNFSVISYSMQQPYYVLAPAYDLLCTRLHINDGDFGLEDRLYENDHTHPSYAHFGFHTYTDFYDFGIKIGLLPTRVEKILTRFTSHEDKVVDYVQRSYLSVTLKDLYIKWYYDKLKRLRTKL